MSVLRIAIQLASLRMPLKQALLTAARLGASAVEIDARSEVKPGELSRTGLRQFRKMLDDLNLRVAAVSFATRRGYNVAEDLEPRVAATKAAMQLAYDLGANCVINHVGRIPLPATGPEWDLLLQALGDLGKYGDRVGARLAARTGSEDGKALAELLAALSPGAIGVDLDPGGLIVNGFSPREAISALGANVIHVHARDAVRDLAQGRGLEVPVGRGSADFPALLAALEQHEYRGYLTIERRAANDPVGEIGDAVEYLKNVQ